MSPRTLPILLLLLSAPAAAAPGVGYATSTNYFKKDSRPTLYQPLNLLDARELTVWCSRGSDAQEDPIRVGFRGPVTIDEIRVYTGNGTDDDTFSEFSRAKKLSIKGPTRGTTFTVADQRGLQAVTLNPPLQGEQFTLEILDAYPADDPESPVCLTDVVFYSDGKPLNGNWLTQKLKYDKGHALVLGTWFAGYKGAPDRYLSFFFDGTFRFLFEPFEKKHGMKERSYGGEYEVRGNTVVLTIGGKRVAGKLSATKGGNKDDFDDTPAGRAITFEGKDVPDDFKQPFRDHT
ncbi:MAG TPA: hypothetical protein VFA20_26390 [Myxococcaceae bacterium]|nr:hypothetical protein [Myxococcaceae bacterium]